PRKSCALRWMKPLLMNTTTSSDEVLLTASVALGSFRSQKNRTTKLFVYDVMAVFGVNDVMTLET
ncbi:MAG TPA: hypothetical protein VHH35_06195, partial [Pyrinomonadaceae bacterium]|nr:hypothetical protein [Pyrinomonadaceae bacterium]